MLVKCFLSPCSPTGHPFEPVVVLGTLGDLYRLAAGFRFIVFEEIPVYVAQVD
jgi:hypothetical protein